MEVEEAKDPYAPYRRLLPLERVRELSTLNEARAVRDTLLAWAYIIGAWAVVYLLPLWWVVLLVIPVIGSSYYALFIIGHDGMHYRLFNNKRHNELFNDLFIFGPIGAITRINKRNHLDHHRHLATDLDPDRYKQTCIGKDTSFGLLFFLSGLRSFWNAIRNVMLNKGQKQTTRPESYTWQDVAMLLSWQVLLIGMLTYFIGWWAYPVLWLVPFYLFTFLMDNFRTFAEHARPEPDRLADTHRLITYVPNRIERTLFAPMNMHYHAVHHLWPSIPYYNLPMADRELRACQGIDGLEWRTSYIAQLRDWFARTPIANCTQ
jgi:fatty acid desaturase